jgi:hypothetical protein
MHLEPLHSSARFGTTVQENLTVLVDLDYSALGRTPKNVAAAVRHVCGLTLPGEPRSPTTDVKLYETIQKYYAQFQREDPSERAARIFLCYFSSFFHELRHVHDLLGSTVGQLTFYNAHRVFQNVPILLNHLWDWQKEHPEGRVPLPLAPWIDLVPGLPEDVQKLFAEWKISGEIFSIFRDVEDHSPGSLTVAHLLETSAINAQLDFVHDILGNEALLDLTHFIEEEGNAAMYLQVRSELQEAFGNADYKGTGVGGLINYLIWVALNQTTPADEPDNFISPVRYFEFLTEEVIQRIPPGSELEMRDLQTAVNAICNDWGLVNPQEMRRQTLQRLNQHLDRLKAAPMAVGKASGSRLLASMIQQYVAIHDLATNTPELMGQRLYVWALLYGKFPSVHVKVFFDGNAHDFMTRGIKIVSVEDWIESATWGGTLRLLTDGMGKTHPEFFEQLCYKMLIEGDEDRSSLRFFNPVLSGFSARP